VHILLIADGRSSITRNWIRMLKGLRYQISLISTFPYSPIPGMEHQYTLPLAFSSLAGSQVQKKTGGSQSWFKGQIARFRPLLLRLRALAAPLTLKKYQKSYLRIIEEVQPDLVHALRIPFEGMLTAVTPQKIPLVVSIWGNDLTFHARTSFLMARHTRKVLQRADGLLADASRDLRLAGKWGLRAGIPAAVLPGSGGLDFQEISQAIQRTSELSFELPDDRPIVVNPRGFRPGSVHQEVFFHCLPKVLESVPQALFVCPGMQDQPQAMRWINDLNLDKNVLLLPYLPQEQLWELFSRSQVYVSLSSHDGTPNTFLESLACGCFPVVGDIESLREWLKDGKNGLLVDPKDANTASAAILRALQDQKMRRKAKQINNGVLKDRADIHIVREQARKLFEKLI